jgi:hypothetical protein
MAHILKSVQDGVREAGQRGHEDDFSRPRNTLT